MPISAGTRGASMLRRPVRLARLVEQRIAALLRPYKTNTTPNDMPLVAPIDGRTGLSKSTIGRI